jgi:hypothetical protein
MLGMVTLKRVQETPEDKREELTAGEIIIPLEDVVVMLPSKSADFANSLTVKFRVTSAPSNPVTCSFGTIYCPLEPVVSI